MKLSTAIRRFDEQMRADGKSPHTRQVYLGDLDRFRSWLGGDVKILTVTPRHLARFLTSEVCTHTVAGNSKATISINRTKSALRSFFAFAVDSGYVKDNPARLVRSARTSQKPPTVLSTAELERLFKTIRRDPSAIAPRDHLMFSLLLGTGMRLGSLVALRVGDIDLSGGTVRIRAKGGAERVVFLNATLSRHIKRHLKGRDSTDGPVFQSAQGGVIRSRQVQLRFASWLNKARLNKRYTVHSLRHTFATRLYESTSDLRLVQLALGHQHVSTTEIYTRVSNTTLRQSVKGLRW